VSRLRSPESSIGTALAAAGLVYGIYTFNTPSSAQIHATRANDVNISKARKKAAVTAAVAVLAVTAMSEDINVFILAGGMLVVLDTVCRHANASAADGTGLVSADNTPMAGTAQLSAAPVAA
jgi:hypothetical protein